MAGVKHPGLPYNFTGYVTTLTCLDHSTSFDVHADQTTNERRPTVRYVESCNTVIAFVNSKALRIDYTVVGL